MNKWSLNEWISGQCKVLNWWLMINCVSFKICKIFLWFFIIGKLLFTLFKLVLNENKIILTNSRFKFWIYKVLIFLISWKRLRIKTKSGLHEWIIFRSKSILNLPFFPMIYVKKSWYFCWISLIWFLLKLNLLLDILSIIIGRILLFWFIIFCIDLRALVYNLML